MAWLGAGGRGGLPIGKGGGSLEQRSCFWVTGLSPVGLRRLTAARKLVCRQMMLTN